MALLVPGPACSGHYRQVVCKTGFTILAISERNYSYSEYIFSIHSTQLLWALLILIMFVIKVAIGVCIACISLFINNSVFFHQLASVNGLALSITCISR